MFLTGRVHKDHSAAFLKTDSGNGDDCPLKGVGRHLDPRHRHILSQDTDFSEFSPSSLLQYKHIHSLRNIRRYPEADS